MHKREELLLMHVLCTLCTLYTSHTSTLPSNHSQMQVPYQAIIVKFCLYVQLHCINRYGLLVIYSFVIDLENSSLLGIIIGIMVL